MLRPNSYVLINDYLGFQHKDSRNKFPIVEFIASPDNIGNMVFLDAINHILPGIQNMSAFDFIEASQRSEIPRDKIVILALANFISPHWQANQGFLQALASHRIVLFSVGLQDENPELSADALTVLELARASGTLIGTRGEATRRFLRAKGYAAEVIGCPSVLARPVPDRLGVKASLGRICTTNTPNGHNRELAKAVNRFSLLMAEGAILQSESGVIADLNQISSAVCDALANECTNPQHAALLRNKLFDYGYYAPDGVDWHRVREWYLAHARFFYRVPQWRSFMSGFDAVIGTRFHGNIVGLQAGCHPIFICPDARVREMVDYHRLPQIDLQTFCAIDSRDDFPADCLSLEAHLEDRQRQVSRLRAFARDSLPLSIFSFRRWSI